MNQWEVFVMDMKRAGRGQGSGAVDPHAESGHHKYTYKHVKCQVSSNLDQHPDRLQVRMGRGQLSAAKFSIKVIEEIQRMPAKYA
jgi:phenylphosphate carboxylase gamma subunit